MKVEEVKERVSEWLSQGFAPSTRRLYRWGLKVFLDFLNETEGGNWTPEKLVSERLRDVEERKFNIERKVVEFYINGLKVMRLNLLKFPLKREIERLEGLTLQFFE